MSNDNVIPFVTPEDGAADTTKKTDTKFDFTKENLWDVLGLTEEDFAKTLQKVMTEFSNMYQTTESSGFTNVYEAFKLLTDEKKPFAERFTLFSTLMMQLNEGAELKQAISYIFNVTSKPLVDRQIVAVYNEVRGMKSAITDAIREANEPKILKP